MQSNEQARRKTRSQLVDDQKEGSRQQLPSQNFLQPVQNNNEADQNKIKEPKQHPARKSNWNKKQRTKYLVFLNYYSELPNWGSDLKSIPTYKALAQFVKSRSPEQCKSFHLSTRRNYNSIQEEMKAIQEQLQFEEGYQKMMDRYEFQIIAFQEEHKILPAYELEEKTYFHNKLLQKCKETGYANKDINVSVQSPLQMEPDYNPRINIKELIKEKEVQEKKKEDRIPSRENYQPLINMHFDNMQRDDNFMNPINTMNLNINQQNENIPKIMMPNPQQGGHNFYGQEMMDKPGMEGLRQPSSMNQSPNFANKNMTNPNEKMMQENISRMMQNSKNMFAQFPGYGPYASNPFGGMSQMHMAQFRNQMPFSMPPPGGIPYIMQGYEPYNMNSMQQRYGLNPENQNDKNKLNLPESQGANPDKQRGLQTQQKEQKVYGQKRKQLLLSCHQHWVNWLRAVTQLNKRKQMGRNVAMTSNQ